MRYLLDTRTFLWWMAEPERLPERVRRILSDEQKEVAFSSASAWEIAIKSSIGTLQGVPIEALPGEIAAQGWHELPLRARHFHIVTRLPDHHRDPFDRALIAQAIVEELAILTGDAKIARYPVEVIW